MKCISLFKLQVSTDSGFILTYMYILISMKLHFLKMSIWFWRSIKNQIKNWYSKNRGSVQHTLPDVSYSYIRVALFLYIYILCYIDFAIKHHLVVLHKGCLIIIYIIYIICIFTIKHCLVVLIGLWTNLITGEWCQYSSGTYIKH